MNLWNLAVIIIIFSQTATGILGNFFLIFHYLVLYFREYTLKPTDLILMNIMAANVLIILSTGVPQTMAVWGFKQFLNDFGCKLLFYIQECGRSVSIGTTCLLSVFQALTICHRKSCWKDHKVKVEKYIICLISLIWILNIFISFIYFSYIIFNRNSKNMSQTRDFGYCSTVRGDEIGDSLYAALVVCPQVFLSVLMAWSSGAMIIILYRHKQRVQHIRSSHGSSRNSPEFRVTQNILILLSNFLAFYTVSSMVRGSIALLNSHNWWLVNISNLTSLCFPSFGPFVLMNHSILSRHCFVLIRNKNH
ncbi:vomeronasal type-1 receptor 4-like [Microtus ochrogaster]|uniref:Vomeronasal type-1 receptor n=1 Tax=Microtus ochrogaster TaxID=79684 RepID=A0ABM0LSL6_MICOH|nr:vomeronasal type-1 receptor 4-like [Microtus ochrogaster]